MGLIAHYRLDGDARDSVGNNHGTYSSVSWVDGKIGQAGNFTPGSGNGVWIPHDDYLSRKVFGVGTTLSFSFWINLHQYSNYGIVIGKQSGGGYDESTSSVWVTKSGIRLHLGTNEPNSVGESKNVSIIPSLNEWHHVAFTSDGSTMRAYLDGSLATQESFSFSRTRSENTSDFQIGTPRTSDSNEGIDGQIQDVRIYDHTLSPREVRDLSLAPAVQELASELDNTADAGNTLTVSGSPAVVGDTSIAFWTYPTTTSRRQTLWDNGYGGEGAINFETDGRLNFFSGPNGNNSSGYTSSTRSSVLSLNSWSHVVAVRDMASQKWRWFINGEPDVFSSHTLTSIGKTTFDLQIGTGYTSDFIGKLRGVKQFACALTPTQIKELYQQKASIDSEGSVHAVSGEVISGIGPAGLQHVNVTAMDGAYFNGYDSYAYYEDMTGDLQPSEISVSVWLDLKRTAAWTPILMLGEKLNSPSDPRDWRHTAYSMWLNHSGLQVMLKGSSYRSPTNSVPLNRLVNLGFTYDGQRVKVFLDGVKVSDEANSGDITYDGGARRILQLGGRNTYSWLNGRIRDVAIVGRAVSETEFLDGLGPETNGLISWLPMRDDTTTINSRGRLGKPVSEVGVTRGLVAWYPLIGDTLDYAGTNHAVNNGAEATADGYEFDGVDDVITMDGPSFSSSEPWTFSHLMNWDSSDAGSFVFYAGVGDSTRGFLVKQQSHVFSFRDENKSYTRFTSSESVNGTWGFVSWVADGAGNLSLYVNGEHKGTKSANTTMWFEHLGKGYGGYLYAGLFRDVRIHNVALTPEEVAMQANLALNPETKTAMTSSCLYTQGQIKEVIA